MIRFEEVSLTFGDCRVLECCTEMLPERGVVCLFGPSGCGKTSFVRVLTGLQKPDSGRVTGICPAEAAVVFQEHRLLPWLTVRENVAAVLPKGSDPLPWLQIVGLEQAADLLPSALSGGMQRRAALARALAYGGKLLVLDEPFQGLDLAAKQEIYPHILAAAAEKPVLLITHDPVEAEALSDEIWYVDGPPLRVLRRTSADGEGE